MAPPGGSLHLAPPNGVLMDKPRSRAEAAPLSTPVNCPGLSLFLWSLFFGLEANQYRFRFQLNAPDFFDAMLNLIFQGEDFRGCGSAAIDDRERVPGGNADTMKAESFGKAGVLDQPRSGNFFAAFKRGIAGYG